MGQDRDDNPYKLSPRFRNKAPVIRNNKFDCTDFFADFGLCLSKNEFDPSKCSEQLRLVDDCKRQSRIVRRASPFGFHFNNVIKNKFRIPIP